MDRVIALNVLYAITDYSVVSSLGWSLILSAPLHTHHLGHIVYFGISIISIVSMATTPEVELYDNILIFAVAIASKCHFPRQP